MENIKETLLKKIPLTKPGTNRKRRKNRFKEMDTDSSHMVSHFNNFIINEGRELLGKLLSQKRDRHVK